MFSPPVSPPAIQIRVSNKLMSNLTGMNIPKKLIRELYSHSRITPGNGIKRVVSHDRQTVTYTSRD